MEISKMIALSTAHIKESTIDWISQQEIFCLPAYQKDDYGWFIFISNKELSDEIENIPKDLCDVISFAKDEGCDWLCLDCDGEIIEVLPVYEW